MVVGWNVAARTKFHFPHRELPGMIGAQFHQLTLMTVLTRHAVPADGRFLAVPLCDLRPGCDLTTKIAGGPTGLKPERVTPLGQDCRCTVRKKKGHRYLQDER